MNKLNSSNVFLAIVLLVFAVGALLLSLFTGGQGLYDGRTPRLTTPDEVLADFLTRYQRQRAESGAFHITAQMLAQWLESDPAGVALIDIREPWEYADFNIAGSINMPLNTLYQNGWHRIPRANRVVVLDRFGERAAEVLPLMRMKGVSAYYLSGGLKEWYKEVLTPACLAEIPLGEARQLVEQRNQWRARFGGAQPAVVAPSPAPVTQAPPASPPKAEEKTRRPGLTGGEGC